MLISIPIRILLVLGSIFTAMFILRRVRYAKVQIEDSLFWLFCSAFLLFLSIFPEITTWVARRLGFISEINVVYLSIIFLLLIKQFYMSVRISQMDSKLKSLVQKVALNEEKIERKDKQE
jgi:hypothetical protein